MGLHRLAKFTFFQLQQLASAQVGKVNAPGGRAFNLTHLDEGSISGSFTVVKVRQLITR
jgi:hypothetical protein